MEKEFESAKKAIEKEIREAIVFLREKNNTIPSETIEFMKVAALEKLGALDNSSHESSGLNKPDVSVSLLEMAYGLVGHPCTNISAGTDLACEQWRSDYERWRNER